MRRIVVGATLVLGLAACKKDDARTPDTTPAAATPATVVAAVGGACPRTGHWGDCQLRAKLEAAGLAPQSTTEKPGDLPDIGVTPVMLSIGNAGLAAYFFPDTLGRQLAAAALDTLKFIPQGKLVGVLREGTVIQNDNALVLLFSRNEHQRERVSDVVTAGPPQP